MQPTIPKLTRSSLHRCLQRHGISRLPQPAADRPARKRFKSYPLGYFHIDIAPLRTAEGKLYLFVAIDRTSKFAFARAQPKADRSAAAEFLRELVAAVPYKLHTVLTDNGAQFTHRRTATRSAQHIFDKVCAEHNIQHRLTQPNHPWTNGQVERMNRTLKEATFKRYHYNSHDQFRSHLNSFLNAYNFARRLKSLNGLTPHQYICNIWSSEPHRFRLDPSLYFPGLNS